MRWIVGSDHAGYELKEQLAEALRGLGDEVVDVGVATSAESVDYPDYAGEVGRQVAAGGGRGLLVCGTGNGIAMAANKIRGVRCAVLTDEFTARMARAHNDANVAAIGSRVTGAGVAEEMLRIFRETEFEGGRHQRRLDKIHGLEEP